MKRYLKKKCLFDLLPLLILAIFISNENFAYNPNHDIYVYLKNSLVFLKI